MLEGMKKILKGLNANTESININITQTKVTLNGEEIEGEAGAKIVHGIKGVFTEVDKAFDKMDEVFKDVGKAFDKMEESIKTKTKGSK